MSDKQKKETSWVMLTCDNIKDVNNFKSIKNQDSDINNIKKESLDTQDNQNNDDYVWEYI